MTASAPLPRRFALGLCLVVLLGLVLRLKGLHDPILDHPGWRQGDEAAIARNFATLDYNPLHPQVDYDGPAPNYVELELQIVPFLAATLYRLFGVHEVFGRMISIGFSLATIVACGLFARYAFRKNSAGWAAALAFALMPGSVYYGRTFMPDTAMTFFLTVGVFAGVRSIARDGERGAPQRLMRAAALMACAVLAKPVAVIGLVPIAVALVAKHGLGRTLRRPATYAYFLAALAPYAVYDGYVRSIAEWHWSSGITTLHVIPGLRAALGTQSAFLAKLDTWKRVLGMLPGTMVGIVATWLAVFGAVVMPRGRAFTALWGWLVAALAYAFIVVTVERVDYYLYPFLPLAALFIGGLVARCSPEGTAPRYVRPFLLVVATACTILAYALGNAAVKPYYTYSKTVYRQARALDASLAPGALIVMGHYDPSVLYYIRRKGWEEDPYVWTAFDEESAIAKGARYFVAIENGRLKRNLELSNWLLRFPVANAHAAWPVYETDPTKLVPGARERWAAFRRRERAGTAR